jgi:hypothetical protein
MFVCPACGFPGLDEQPWRAVNDASFEICPCCGIQFGFHDWADGKEANRGAIHLEWRRAWIREGMPWRDVYPPPPGWDPHKQLENLSINEPD